MPNYPALEIERDMHELKTLATMMDALILNGPDSTNEEDSDTFIYALSTVGAKMRDHISTLHANYRKLDTIAA